MQNTQYSAWYVYGTYFIMCWEIGCLFTVIINIGIIIGECTKPTSKLTLIAIFLTSKFSEEEKEIYNLSLSFYLWLYLLHSLYLTIISISIDLYVNELVSA